MRVIVAITSAQLLEKYGFSDETQAEIDSQPLETLVDPNDARSWAAKKNDMFPETPRTSDSFFGRRLQDFERGSKQIEALAGGTLYAGGKAVGWEDLQNYSEIFTLKAERGVVRFSPRVGSLANTENFGDICEYGAEVFLESIPLFMFSMIAVLLFRKARKVVTDWLQVRVIQ